MGLMQTALHSSTWNRVLVGQSGVSFAPVTQLLILESVLQESSIRLLKKLIKSVLSFSKLIKYVTMFCVENFFRK